MALLQICEPGLSPEPHQRRLAIGIDLGTTNSLVATVRNGVAETLPDEQDRHLLPSVVHYLTDHIEVGWQARQHAALDPSNTIISVKRMIGRSLADIQQRYTNLPYHFTTSENGLPVFKTAAGLRNPIQVSADILSALEQRAEQTFGEKINGAVITVPAYFDDSQRQATKDAAQLAGLHVLRLLNEPTAAAIAYGLDSGQEGIIAVYDLGGGTFDISILRLNKGVFEVLATGGDSALGGDDFDHLIVQWIKTQLPQNEQYNAVFERQLLDAAIVAKIGLSNEPHVAITIDEHEITLSRETFNDLIQPLIKKTLIVCRRTLKDANVEPEEVQQIVMVGGSTRVPAVRNGVENYFHCKPLTSIDPDRVVALGAAIQADILVGNKPDNQMLLLDVIPLSLGIETMGDLMEKIIPRNTTIPCAIAQEFTTFKDGQTAMRIHVLQGERERVSDCRSLAHFTLHGIPPLPAGAAHIRVTFQVDADGLLSVTAMEKTTGVQSSIQIKPSYGLSDTEIAEMIQSGMKNAQEDLEIRRVAELKIDAMQLIEGTKNALAKDGKLLHQGERAEIENAITILEEVMKDNNAFALEGAINVLDHATQDFAAKRMDNSVREALTGQSIDEI